MGKLWHDGKPACPAPMQRCSVALYPWSPGAHQHREMRCCFETNPLLHSRFPSTRLSHTSLPSQPGLSLGLRLSRRVCALAKQPWDRAGAEAAGYSGQLWERGGVSSEAALRSKHQPCRGLAIPVILTHHAGSQQL